MAVYKLDPASTVSNNWTLGGTPGTAHGNLTDSASDPTAPSTDAANQAATSTTGNIIEVAVADQTLGSGENPTQIQAKVYGLTSGTRRTMTIDLRYNVGGSGADTSLGTTVVGVNSAAAWRTVAASTAGLTQAELNSLRIRITATVSASTSTGTATAHSAYVSLTTLVLTPIGNLSDDFEDNSLDTGKWAVSGGTSETGGRISIPASSSYPWFRSAVDTYTLKDSAMYSPIPVRAGGAATAFALRDDGNANGWYFDISSDGNLYMYERVASVNDSTSVTYSGTDHLWLKLRHDTTAGLVYWETSPDGVDWTTRRSKSPGLSLTVSGYRVWGYAGGTSPTGTSEFESFNIPASTDVQKTASDTATTSDAGAVLQIISDNDDLTLVTDTASLLLQYSRADALTFGDDVPAISMQEAKSGSDSVSATDTSTMQQQRSVVDALTQSDAGGISASLSVSEAYSLAEALSLSQQRSASDSTTFTDTSSVAALLSLSVAETFLWTDSISLSALLSQIDSDALSESLSVAAVLGVADSMTWSEAATQTNSLATGDSLDITDASSVLSTLAVLVNDSHTLADSSLLSAAMELVEAHVQAEAATLASTLSVVESGTFADVAALLAEESLSVSDSLTVSEAAALANSLGADDAAALSDAATLLTTLDLSSADSLTLADIASLSAAAGVSDAVTVSDTSAVLSILAVSVADSVTVGELAVAAVALASADEQAVEELGIIEATAAIAVFDSLVLFAEQALAVPLAAPADIDLPTRAAVVAWASRATLALFTADASTVAHESNAVIVGNIKAMALANSKTSVVLAPIKTGVTIG